MSAEQRGGGIDAAEKAEGFKPLFDGVSLKGWRAYKSDTPPAGMEGGDGELVREGAGGDLMTTDQFADFELRFDWKIAKNGNSGIMFRVRTGDDAP